MVGRPKSDVKKLQIIRNTHDALMSRAVAAYRVELAKPEGSKRRGARIICKDFETLYTQETGKDLKLSYSTLTRLASGGKSKAVSNADRAWLTKEEEKVVVSYIIEMGNRGFPLSHRRLKEHVDTICKARLPTAFPATGVGKKWTNRFAEKHSEEIKLSWSRPLEMKRGRAVNSHTNEAWFDLLGNTITKYNIKEKNTYAVDEIGIHGSLGQPERVFGAQKQGPQYQQRDGDRENITVLVTICADGTSTAPAVIFKGAAYQVKWNQENPANASYVLFNYVSNIHSQFSEGWAIQRKAGQMAKLELNGSRILTGGHLQKLRENIGLF
jgi:hypothetical protein